MAESQRTHFSTTFCQKEIRIMFKKLSLAVAFLALMSIRAMADDGIESGKIDLSSISDADNTVVGASLDVDVDELTNKTGDKSDVAVEACFRSWGGCGYGCNYGYNYGCYNSCYSSCYSPCYSYSYCYQPTYYCYRPVTYYVPCYSYSTCCSYPLYNWGCY
jgi:hypothetical protein